MRYRNLALGGIAFVLAIFYALYKRSPTIQQSLIRDGFQLISKSEKKKEIYTDILERHKEEINAIVLDQYLINNDRKWEALSFWCDLEVNNNSFLRTLDNHKRFCVMAIMDSAKDLQRSPQEWPLSEAKRDRFVKAHALTATSAEEVEKNWISWCKDNSIKPLWRATKALAEDVYEYCFKANTT